MYASVYKFAIEKPQVPPLKAPLLFACWRHRATVFEVVCSLYKKHIHSNVDTEPSVHVDVTKLLCHQLGFMCLPFAKPARVMLSLAEKK